MTQTRPEFFLMGSLGTGEREALFSLMMLTLMSVILGGLESLWHPCQWLLWTNLTRRRNEKGQCCGLERIRQQKTCEVRKEMIWGTDRTGFVT